MAGALRSQDGKLVGPGSVKALEMRGYNVTSGDTGDYTIDSANTEEDKNYSQEQESLDSAFIPDDESFTGSTILDTTYNAAKTVSDFALETLPAAESVLNPVGKYSGLYDYFNTLATTDTQHRNQDEFVKISKNQMDNESIVPYLEKYKQDYSMTEERVVDYLNKNLGLNIISIEDMKEKYSGNEAARDAIVAQVKDLEKNYMTDNDFQEDEDYYYVKNFKDIDMGANVAWTKYGDLQMPHLGIFKFDEDGQGSMMRNSATNLKDSAIPGASFLGDQGFGASNESYTYDTELYGSPFAQGAGELIGGLGSLFVGNAGAIKNAPGFLSKVKAASPVPLSMKGAAGVGGIASIPVAGYSNIFE